MSAAKKALAKVAVAGLREFVSALASAAGQNLGVRLVPPLPDKKSSGDDKEK